MQQQEMVGMLMGMVPQLLMMVLSGIVGWLGGKIKGAAKEREEARNKSTRERDESRSIQRLLLYYRLHDLFDEYVVGGADISSADKHEIEEVYNYYHNLGGNGEGSRMYKELMALKTT